MQIPAFPTPRKHNTGHSLSGLIITAYELVPAAGEPWALPEAWGTPTLGQGMRLEQARHLPGPGMSGLSHSRQELWFVFVFVSVLEKAVQGARGCFPRGQRAGAGDWRQPQGTPRPRG